MHSARVRSCFLSSERFIVECHGHLGTDDGCLYAALCSWYDGTEDTYGLRLSARARGDLVLGPRDYSREGFTTPRQCDKSTGGLSDGQEVKIFPGRRFEEGILYRVLFQDALIEEQQALELAAREPGYAPCDSDYWADLPTGCIPGVDVTCREMAILAQWFEEQQASCLC